jgi:threonine synthase
MSTRDPSLSFSFEEALCGGYAPDGGLFVPARLPKVDASMLNTWSRASYPELAAKILRLFISPDEISDEDLFQICQNSLSFGFEKEEENSSKGRDLEIVPIKRIGSSYMVELFHGPTFCFKDFGMRVVVNMLSYFATKRQQNITLIVSTTGDTGPAAVKAVSDADNPLLTLLVHYPKGQISAFQRKQLTTVKSPRVRVVAFEGGGDDMDLPIKNILTTSGSGWGKNSAPSESGGRDTTDCWVCGVNSYNIGRPLVQLVHFVWTYLRVSEQEHIDMGDGGKTVVDIVLPTGAMGNMAGGFMAKKMGVPIGKLCAGVNVNDITHRVIQKGEFYKSVKMEKTLSDAINIQVPYNFERILFYLSDCNHEQVRAWMEIMEETQKLNLEGEWLEKLQTDFSSARITDEEMCKTMQKVYDEYNYLVDPHTAVAIAAAEKNGYHLNQIKSGLPFAILSTAAPCKFEESVTVALGKNIWEQYVKDQFPAKAKAILSESEREPTIYEQSGGSSLETIQRGWEENSRNIIREISFHPSLVDKFCGQVEGT